MGRCRTGQRSMPGREWCRPSLRTDRANPRAGVDGIAAHIGRRGGGVRRHLYRHDLLDRNQPVSPLHKRRNWFVGVQPVRIDEQPADLRKEDIRYQTFRASGPGGQHVNKTDSAVRAKHLPTGLVVSSQDQRSQFANKRIARLKLAMLLDDRRRADQAGGKRALWDHNRELERGNAARTYEGDRFRRR